MERITPRREIYNTIVRTVMACILIYIAVLMSIWHYHWNTINSTEYMNTIHRVVLQNYAIEGASNYLYHNDTTGFLQFNNYYEQLQNTAK